MVRRETFLTEDGLKHLQEELDHLRSVRRQQVAADIHRASETGASVDNAEYDEAKNEQARTEGRIQYLETTLSNAVVATMTTGKNAVQFGSSVTVTTPNGAKRNYKVVGTAEAAPLDGKISNESPVGQAILGRKAGKQVEVSTPSGVTTLTIIKVR